MKRRTTTGSKPVQHKMYMTDLYHSSATFCTVLIVLAVPAIPAMPGVCPLHHPAFRQRRETWRARWTRLDFDAPASTMCGHPGIQGMVMRLLSRKDRAEPRKGLGRDVAEQDRGRHASIKTGTGNQDNPSQAQRIDQQMPLAPVDCLAPIIPTLGAFRRGGLDRWAIDARGTGGGCTPRCHAGPLASGLDQLGPSPVVAPLGNVVQRFVSPC